MESIGLCDNSTAPSGPEYDSSSSGGTSSQVGDHDWWMSAEVMTSIATINLLLIIASAVANSLVLVLFCASRSLRKPQNLLTFNLALSNLLTALFCGVVTASISQALQPETDPVMCVIVAVVLTSSCTCAICAIANIALLRYISIVRTGLQARLCRWSVVIPFCIGCWLLNFIILGVLIAKDRMRAVRKPVTRQCSFDFSYNRVYSEVAAIVICLQMLIVAGAYVSIYRFVHQSKTRVQGHSISSSKEAEHARNRLRQEMRLVAPMLAIFLCFCGSWTAYVVVDIFVDPSELRHPWSHVLTQFLLLLNSIADPVICVAFNQVYREELRRLVLRCHRSRRVGTLGGPTVGIRAIEAISCGHGAPTGYVGTVDGFN